MLLLAAALAVVPPPGLDGRVVSQRPDTKLTQIVIPGTHDSGAFKIDTEGTCKLTAIAGANQAEAGTAKTNPCGAGRLAKAQSKNFTGQLNGGIRYLDMRLGVPDNKVVTAKKAGKKLTKKAAAKVPIPAAHLHLGSADRRTQSRSSGSRKPTREQVILDFQHIDLTGRRRSTAITHRRSTRFCAPTKSMAAVCVRAPGRRTKLQTSRRPPSDKPGPPTATWWCSTPRASCPRRAAIGPARRCCTPLAEHRRSGEVRDRQPGVLDEPAVCAGRPDQLCGRRR